MNKPDRRGENVQKLATIFSEFSRVLGDPQVKGNKTYLIQSNCQGKDRKHGPPSGAQHLSGSPLQPLALTGG